MNIAIQEAKKGVESGHGGPFGAVIIDNKNKIIAKAHNMVLITNDPTAHAEIVCIREASKKLSTFNLSNCKIFSTCEPCPMCFGAIHWAKIPLCIYAATAKDAKNFGFDDDFIYDAIRKKTTEKKVKMVREKNDSILDIMKLNYKLY